MVGVRVRLGGCALTSNPVRICVCEFVSALLSPRKAACRARSRLRNRVLAAGSVDMAGESAQGELVPRPSETI